MDPGTAAILTLSAITGISGYGAMKMNAKAKANIDDQVKAVIGDTQAIIAATQKAKEIAEKERNKKEDEVKTLTAEIAKLKETQQKLQDDKIELSNNLESATELEKTYRALTPEAFIQAIKDFMENPEIKKLGDLKEVFDPLLSRYSVSRGTAQSLYTKLSNTGVTPISKSDFDTLLLDTLKDADRSLEQTRLEEDQKAKDAKTKKDQDAKDAKKIKDDAATAAAEAATAAKKIKDDAAKAAKDAKEAKTLQLIVVEALEAATKGPLTSNTLYQSIKTPFLSGVDSVARGVQKVGEVAKQAVTKTGEIIRAPLTRYEERQKQYKEALKQQGGAGDTFDTDVYYRLFHPKDEDRPNKTLAYLFEKTSDDTLAKNMLPIFDAFMYWRKTVLNSPILYKPELVAAAETLFKYIQYQQISAVFRNAQLEKAIEEKIIAMYPDQNDLIKREEAYEKELEKRNPEKLKLILKKREKTEKEMEKLRAETEKVEAKKAQAKAVTTVPNPMVTTPTTTVPNPMVTTPTTGGMRKKKLRTRREGKQNVRRTRRSKNRPNRSDTYSS